MSDFSRAYALSGSNLVSFDPTSPTVGTTIVITGLALGEALGAKLLFQAPYQRLAKRSEM